MLFWVQSESFHAGLWSALWSLKTDYVASWQWLNPRAAARHARVCTAATTQPFSASRGPIVLFQTPLTPALFSLCTCVSQTDGPAMEWFRCLLRRCKYGSTVPGGYTICTCSFVFEYEPRSPPPPVPSPPRPRSFSVSPPSLSLGPFFFSVGGNTGVFELSVQCVSSSSPCSLSPLDCPCWGCLVQEVGAIDVSLYVPVEHV